MIIGAGFGGYFAVRRPARKLHPSEAEIIDASDSDGLLYQPLLPEVAVGALDPRTRSPTIPAARARPSELRT